MSACAPVFVRDLAAQGDRTALLAPDGSEMSYADLDRHVRELAGDLRGQRQLVLVAGSNTVGSIVAYLAALAAGHVVLLGPGDHPEAISALIDAYDPDVIVGPPASRDEAAIIERRRRGSSHALHPDLALLLSTSGSTGSPKLVRLSRENLDCNAAAIVESLGIRDTDRAATTLPMHYTYGLSVLHSHLLAGAGLIVTDLSVVDPCFWQRFRAADGTTLAGVPYTFDMLDAVGFPDLDLPKLRSVTQAGGRLDPARVRAYAELGRARGWTFTVMYGQTEATARMAVLPPDLAIARPNSIGRAIPGGDLRVEPVAGAAEGIGELVYRGPNVMLGYAHGPMDLALGRTVDALRTNDLGRALPDGLFEVTGRLGSFVKVAGVRIDLDDVERRLKESGSRAWLAGDDEGLVVAVQPGEDAEVARRAASLAGLPSRLVRTIMLEHPPLLATGKVDRSAIVALAEGDGRATARDLTVPGSGDRDPETAIRMLYREALGREAGPADSFVGLGGDSLSYVYVALGLEEILARQPADWPSRPIRELAAVAGPLRRNGSSRLPKALAPRWIDMTVLLRAIAIVCIVAQHTGLAIILGGAHVLIAVAGYNFARFQLTPAVRLDRLRSQARAIARIAVPTVIWVGLMLLLGRDYGPANLLLINSIVGPDRFDTSWHFWFLEMLIYLLAAMAILGAIPAVDRLERSKPFALAAAMVAVGLVLRFGIVDLGLTNPRPVLWLFAIGWAAGKATSRWQRLGLVVVTILAVPGFFGDPQREAIIAAGLVALIAIRAAPIPRMLGPVAAVLAGASLYIYVVHWQVWTSLDLRAPILEFALCIGAGLVAWWIAGRAVAIWRGAQETYALPRSGGTSAARADGLAPGRT